MATPRTAQIPKGSQRFAGHAVHLPLPSSHCSGRPAGRSKVQSVTASSDAPVFPDHKIAVFSTKPYVRESFQPLVEQSFPNAVFYEVRKKNEAQQGDPINNRDPVFERSRISILIV
jgi:hypothetical protein